MELLLENGADVSICNEVKFGLVGREVYFQFDFLIVAEKDEPLCREDFRRPGVLSVYLFEQKKCRCLARSRSRNRHWKTRASLS